MVFIAVFEQTKNVIQTFSKIKALWQNRSSSDLRFGNPSREKMQLWQ